MTNSPLLSTSADAWDPRLPRSCVNPISQLTRLYHTALHLGAADPHMMAKVVLPKDLEKCWEWSGAFFSNGYARYTRGRHHVGTQRVHIMLYEQLIGPVPPGMTLDHFRCNRKCCVNPYHLEVVTNLENIQRYYATITHCPAGHEYNKENTRYFVDGRGYNVRTCRICSRRHTQRHRIKKMVGLV